ncbi:hypothetical protein E3N88_33366 [Mikania micrantha]|uniref:Uncharacterized protein n=1 Tax=Mikania micrantha TaxID=192012 RepID=A0A5N6MB45_9ASTR|nr:hypothetical protein E3N88_33366 [Mikania micrantha]
MDIESSGATIRSKKLWTKVKIVLYMLRKTLAKTKLLVDLHINLKDRKLAQKAFTTLLLHQHAATACGGCTNDNIDALLVSPHIPKLQTSTGSISKSNQRHDGGGIIEPPPPQAAVSLELRVNEYESLLWEDQEESQVDKAAEAFIKKFYKQLKQQHITCVESPSPNHL